MDAEATCMQTAEVIKFNREISIEDIPCVINPLLACDLKQILLITPEDIRLNVALVFCRITHKELAIKAGLHDGKDNSGAAYNRWFTYKNKLPLGAAFRLAKVIGVSVEILFASKLWRQENDCK